MTSSDFEVQIFEDLVVAVLAVNNHPMEKVYAILPRLRELRLTDPSLLANEDVGNLTVLLGPRSRDRPPGWPVVTGELAGLIV